MYFIVCTMLDEQKECLVSIAGEYNEERHRETVMSSLNIKRYLAESRMMIQGEQDMVQDQLIEASPLCSDTFILLPQRRWFHRRAPHTHPALEFRSRPLESLVNLR